MNRRVLSLTIAGLVAGTAMACAHTQPPPELLDARAAYQRASTGPAATIDPAALHVAQESLATAEQSYNDKGDDQSTRDLAYTATRKAQLAEAETQVKVAMSQRDSAAGQAAQTEAQALQNTKAALTGAQQTVAAQQMALTAEQQARADAEKRAQQASADLARVAAVKQEARGMVITLSGAVLFESGKATLLPAAQAKLADVASALTQQSPDSKMRVEGHTDTQGSAAFNLDLSQRRADAVRDFLTQHGVAADRLTAVGMGSTKPVASNGTAEGRADNRRVEIIVTNSGQGADSAR